MNEDYVITIDYGTQSVRVSLIDKNGKFLGFEREVYAPSYHSPKPGFCEQDPDYYYDCMCKAAKRLTSKHQDLMKNVKSISSTCIRDSVAFLDENFKSVRPAIIWLDQRQAELKKKVPFIYRVIFKIIGMDETIKLNRKKTPAIWLQENEPELYKKIKHYAPLNSYFNYRMIGEYADGASNMIGHFPMDFKNGKRHSKRHIRGCFFNIDPKLLPRIAKTHEVLGTITEKCHEETGFPLGLKYIVTGNDKSCEALGSGAVENDIAHISYGTSSSINTLSKRYFNAEKFLPSYITCYPGKYTNEIQIYRGFWMLKWFIKEFGEKETLEVKDSDLCPEELLDKKILDIEPGSNGLMLQPYWGPGLSRPQAKGSVVGFYDVHTKYHIYRSIIEGIGYALKEGLATVSKRGHIKINKLTVAGGGSRSDVVCQITSDMFNLPVYKTVTSENSSLGCAMSQFVALKDYKDVNEAKEHMVKYEKIFKPNKTNNEEYERLYKDVYLKLYPSLKNIYKTLDKEKERHNKKD